MTGSASASAAHPSGCLALSTSWPPPSSPPANDTPPSERPPRRAGCPGGQPGRPISTERLKLRLNRLGIRPNQARSTALGQLATEIPAAILARTLGISVNSAVRWQQISAGDWASYAADVSSRPRPQRTEPTDRRDESVILTVFSRPARS